MSHSSVKTVILGKLKTNIIYIYGVGTYEEYRKQELCQKHLKHLLKDMFMDEEAFTYLIPSDEGKAKVYVVDWGLNMLWIQNLKPVDHKERKLLIPLFTES